MSLHQPVFPRIHDHITAGLGKLPDRADEPFLETAISGKAKVLATGNIKHFPRAKRAGVKVMTPREFPGYFDKQKV